jgi:flagellar biosynthesis/type III secretory pathway chaperone
MRVSPTGDDHGGLLAVLHEQIRCAAQMLRTLGRENQALVDGNVEELNAAGGDKARLVEELEALEVERRQLTDAIEAELAPQPSWDQLLQLISECKEQNQRNGVLLKARSEQVRTALKLLRGSEPNCYDATGLTSGARAARPLASA